CSPSSVRACTTPPVSQMRRRPRASAESAVGTATTRPMASATGQDRNSAAIRPAPTPAPITASGSLRSIGANISGATRSSPTGPSAGRPPFASTSHSFTRMPPPGARARAHAAGQPYLRPVAGAANSPLTAAAPARGPTGSGGGEFGAQRLDQLRQRHLALVAGAHVLDHHRVLGEFALAQHQREPGAGAVGGLHGALHAAAAVGQVDPDARG